MLPSPMKWSGLSGQAATGPFGAIPTKPAGCFAIGRSWRRGKMEKTYKQIEIFLDDIGEFTEYGGDIKLRSYQSEGAERICAAVFDQKGLSFVVMFPRHSGNCLLYTSDAADE